MFRLLADVARSGAARFPERTALEAAASRASGLTYAELWERAEHAAGSLCASGLAPGDRVLLVLPGRPEWAVAFFAILRAGLVAVPVPAEADAAALAAIAVHARARLGVGSARALPAGLRATTIEELLAAPRVAPPRAEAGSPADLALLAFTSGSTARPRAVELTHASLLACLDALLQVRAARPGDAMLSMLPPAHLFELVVGLLAPLACGLRVVYAGAPLPNRLIDALKERGITHALTVPALLHALYDEILAELAEGGAIAPARRGQELAETARLLEADPGEARRIRAALRARIGSTFRVLCVGGAAVDPVWPRVLAPLGIAMEVGYGLTEASPIVSLGAAGECPSGSVGRPLPSVEVRVDERGEILVRGPNVMRGYAGDPQATALALDGGWLRTGDLGRIDAQGFLFVTGRLKEAMVTAAGETIQPDEVEPYYASPLFAEHCVVPVRQPDGNDLPTLVVVAAPEHSDAELARAFARLRAAAPARCRVAGPVRLGRPLPRTALGKLRRRALAETLGESGRRYTHGTEG